MLQDLGCVDALNLDGGGSTLLYANKYILNHYSDAVPRPVVSSIVIRDKYRKKVNNLVSQWFFYLKYVIYSIQLFDLNLIGSKSM